MEQNNHGRFSKRVITAMIILWFVGAGYGMFALTVLLFKAPEYFNMEYLLAYIGVPIGGGIVTYLLKSMFENKEKIKKSPSDDIEEAEFVDELFDEMEEENE